MSETMTDEPTQNGESAPRGESAEQVQTAPEKHFEKRTIVFPEQRILYVPVPKAGCTAILWALASVAGLEEERFHASFIREVSRSLTIHDLGRWPDEFVFARLSAEQKDEVLESPDWLRFTVVRHPLRRLWSAWQSKILLSEPQFTDKFSKRPWFPASIESADGILKMFRQFIEAIEEDGSLGIADVHWAPQVTLISGDAVDYGHVGQIEQLSTTMDRVREHLAAVGAKPMPDLARTNPTPLPYADELFDEAAVGTLARAFEDDMREFEYDAPPAQALTSSMPQPWIDAVDAAVPALRALRQRNQRVGDLQRVFLRHRREMNAALADERRRSKGFEHRLRDTRERLQETKSELAGIRNSASWRYTSFLRRLTRFKRKVVGRLRS